MKSIIGTQTEKNILTAFAGESQARNRYDYFSAQAKKEGYVQISDTFAKIALQEKEHAKRLFKFLEGGEVTISDTFPAGKISTTLENLQAAANGENHEHAHMYPEFAKIAEDEGFLEIAKVMRHIAIAEEYHEALFLSFKKHIEDDTVFKRETEVRWHCRNCGYTEVSKNAPDPCPACNHPQAHFDVVHK